MTKNSPFGRGEFGSIRLSFFYWGHPTKRELATLTSGYQPCHRFPPGKSIPLFFRSLFHQKKTLMYRTLDTCLRLSSSLLFQQPGIRSGPGTGTTVRHMALATVSLFALALTVFAEADDTPLTIGLWHETIPSATWQVDSLPTYLQGTSSHPGTGFTDYAEAYVQYVKNLKSLATAKGASLGTVYFALGDPDVSNWSGALNNAYKYASPHPGPNVRPLINEHVIEPLAKAGVTQFGFVIGDIGTPWNWIPAAPGSVSPPGTNQNIESVFQLIAELNNDLAAHYPQGENKLYIQHLGLDNEGFGEIYKPQTCPPAHTPGTIINQLWDHYIAPEQWGTGKYQWGTTGASPPFVYECKESKAPYTQHTIEASRHETAFIEYYNVPGNDNAVFMFDHPGYVPCSSPWSGDATTTTCDHGDEHANINIYYGLNTPARKQHSLLNRDITPDNLHEIYNQTKPTLAEIMVDRDKVDPEFLAFIYETLNQKRTPNDAQGNLTTLSESDLYKNNQEGARWMLSIENLSSSYAAIKPAATLPTAAPYALLKDQVDVTQDESSITLKFLNKAPFNLDASKEHYLLNQPLNTSGSFEAFGGWELEEIIDLVAYLNTQNSNLQNFMLYEFAFAKVKQTRTPLLFVPEPTTGLLALLALVAAPLRVRHSWV